MPHSNFRIGPVVLEIRGGGARNSPPPSGARYKNTPVGRGLKPTPDLYLISSKSYKQKRTLTS